MKGLRGTPTASKERALSNAPIWGSLLLSAGAWSIHFVGGYFAAELVCEQLALFGRGEAPPNTAFRLILVVVSAVFALIALLAGGYAWSKRYSFTRRGPGASRATGLPDIMAALSVFFAVLIVVEAVPLFMIACGGG